MRQGGRETGLTGVGEAGGGMEIGGSYNYVSWRIDPLDCLIISF